MFSTCCVIIFSQTLTATIPSIRVSTPTECRLGRRRYTPGSFRYFEGCEQIHCFCNHDGHVDCPVWMRENICEVFGVTHPSELRRKHRALYRLVMNSNKGGRTRKPKSKPTTKSTTNQRVTTTRSPKIITPTTPSGKDNQIHHQTSPAKQDPLLPEHLLFPPTPRVRDGGKSSPGGGWKPRGPRRPR